MAGALAAAGPGPDSPVPQPVPALGGRHQPRRPSRHHRARLRGRLRGLREPRAHRGPRGRGLPDRRRPRGRLRALRGSPARGRCVERPVPPPGAARVRAGPPLARPATVYFFHALLVFARLAFGCTSPCYMTGPMIHGANSSSPTPDSSLLLRLPEATATISSKICRPTSGSGVPSRITPQLMSISSDMCRYMRLLVASLIEGTGLQPNTEPRPVVKQIMLQPPATSPVMDTGSCPGVSMNTKPRQYHSHHL